VSETVLSAVLSAVIAGVFSLIGKRMEIRQQTAGGGTTTSTATGGPMQPAAAGTINYGRALIDIGILQLILNLAGFVIGYSIGAALSGTTSVENIFAIVYIVILLVGTILLSIGFFWRALLVDRSVRWKHFSLVAVGVALTTLVINLLILQGVGLGGGALVFAFAQTFVCMGIGVGLANRTGR
jgi:hypothetical protein